MVFSLSTFREGQDHYCHYLGELGKSRTTILPVGPPSYGSTLFFYPLLSARSYPLLLRTHTQQLKQKRSRAAHRLQ